MTWKFFLGACVLTAAVLQPHAPIQSILGGMGIAALAQWGWSLAIRQRQRRQGIGDPNGKRKGPETDR